MHYFVVPQKNGCLKEWTFHDTKQQAEQEKKKQEKTKRFDLVHLMEIDGDRLPKQ